MTKQRATRLILIIGIGVICTFFSWYKLTEAPAFWFDEGYFTQAAMNIARYGVWGIQTAPDQFSSLLSVSAGFPLLAPLALIFKIFGISIVSARAGMAVGIMLFVAASFFLMKRLNGFYFAAGSSLLLSTFPVLYGNGRAVLGEVPALLMYVLFLLSLLSWIQSQKKIAAFAAGLLLGLTITAKLSFLLVGVPATAITILIYRKKLRSLAASVPLFIGGVVIPFSIWIATQFNAADTVSGFFNVTFNHYQGDPAIQLITQNVIKFFTEFSPVALLILCAVWATSLAIRGIGTRSVSLIETHAALFSLFMIGIFLLSPGWYRYFFPAQILALLFFPSSLSCVVAWLHGHQSRVPVQIPTRAITVCVVLLMSVAQAYQTGFNSYIANYYGSDRNQHMQRDFAALPVGPTYFFYNVPELLLFVSAPIAYYQFIGSSAVPHAIGLESVAALQSGVADFVIVNQQAYRGHENEFVQYEPDRQIARVYLILKKRNTP
ncbi:MAG: hypothetical protein A3C15_04125 [Candidatus Magasanikbacteria bacterium RIFCSPHIGHO2_02_FULL_50_9b]|uniref:Glycosyltransferase RgtA/B/C/D-like domain-containing protein n=2 Tax=Candidatus Magasanikiibacteriota TaxID=1752731 RepID=A0A1F6M8W2_9BACT|nr:MAG: hypothetical protein A3C15_04125 [Candidatus Magasanikbacteria bacterium RIFCSPHIGHO2_02_FULL_50_9b]